MQWIASTRFKFVRKMILTKVKKNGTLTISNIWDKKKLVFRQRASQSKGIKSKPKAASFASRSSLDSAMF